MSDTTTQQDDTQVNPVVDSSSAQGGAFGGKPYDPAHTSTDGDFVLDMDEIPDFSLDDLGEDIQEEIQTPSVDQSPQDVPVPTSPAPDVAPVAPEISLDLDDLGDSIKESAEQAATPVNVATSVSEESSPAVESAPVGDFDLDLGSLEESTSVSDVPATPVADVTSETVADPVATPDTHLTVDAVETPSTQEPVVSAADDISFDLGDITEPAQEAVESVTEVTADTPASDVSFDLGDITEQETAPVVSEPEPTVPTTDDSFDLNLDTVEEKTPSTESETPATPDTSTDIDLNLDGAEEVAPTEPVAEPSPTPETETSTPTADDVDLGDVAPVVEEESAVENMSTEPVSVSDAVDVVAPAVVAVATVDVSTDNLSPLGTKVVSLMNRTLEAQSMLDEPVRVLGASHDREQVHYEFSMDDDQVLTVVRDAVDGDDTVTKTNLTLSFVGSSLVVRLDDVVVFDEDHDENIYQKYAHTISEKMGKFGMHIDDYVAGAQDKVAEKAATQQIKQAGKQLQAF